MEARLLGADELGVHEALAQLERQAQEDIDAFTASTELVTKAGHAAFDQKMQAALAALRARIRDLDLMAEEQDT